MKFSVVIPTCGRAAKLRECLRRVTAQMGQMGQMGQPGDYEVIVSDDGRVGRSVAAGFEGVEWTRGPRRGPAANRNCGARMASGDWLVFVDDDCLPEHGWLAAYEAAAEVGVDVMEGRTECPMEDRFGFDQIVENLDGGAYWSCNLAVRREKFEELGGFDEDFTEPCAEDMEFAWRMRGLKSVFVEKATVMHPARRMGMSELLKRTAAHRWVLLYRLKTGQWVRGSMLRTVVALVGREYLDCLRMLFGLRRGGRRKGRVLGAVWKLVSLAGFLPYYVYWEVRWHRESGKAGGLGRHNINAR